LFALPEAVPMHHVPMVEMFALGHHVLRRGRVMPGETVAILGAGKLGLSVLDVLCHGVGAATVLMTDVQPFRLAMAEKLGATRTIDPRAEDPVDVAMEMTKGVGVDCVIECIGHYHDLPGREAPLQQAVNMIRNGGRVVTAGLGEQLSPVHFKTLVMKEAQIIASRVTAGEFPRALFMMGKGLVHTDLLITHQMPLRDVTAAFRQVDKDEPGTIKVVLNMQDT
jgi:threonine dehydrogenase-like Zn-dependent dehydrogenase